MPENVMPDKAVSGNASLITSDQPIPAPLRETLRRLLDLMIPASGDGQLPSAGSLDLYADRGRLDDAALATLGDGLSGIAALARERSGREFAALDDADAMALVNEYRAIAPQFFGVFVVQSAARYYQHDRVLIAIGLEPRAPFPLGNDIPEGDWSLLDPVRARAAARGPLYRRA
jgi:hypothetical protein